MKYPVFGYCSSMVMLSVLFFFSGCSRYFCWAKKTFRQADELGISVAPAQAYLRSVYVYDQFATVGLFEGLWLTDTVRDVAQHIFATRWAIDDNEVEEVRDQQHAENRDTLSFYLLMTPDSENYFVSLTKAQATWSILLAVDGRYFVPNEIKAIDLDPEYLRIFGSLYSHFKIPYLITFDAVDEQGDYLISDQTRTVQLVLRSVKYRVSLDWHMRNGKLVCD